MDAVAAVNRLSSVDISSSTRAVVSQVLRDVTACRNWLAALEIACQARLERLAGDDPAINPDAENAEATNRSQRAGQLVSKRARTVKDAPRLHDKLASGELSAEHLDVFTAAITALPSALRPHLMALHERLADLACRMTADEFREHLRREVRSIEADDGRSRLQRQKAATRLRVWTDNNTGMTRLAGWFDPETGLILASRLQSRLEALFHESHPEHAPEDPGEKQDFLRAHALVGLITCNGNGAGAGAPEFVIVIDEDTYCNGRHARSRVECGHGIDLPIDTIRSLGGRARFVPVVINTNGVVIRQGRPVPSFDQLRLSLEDPVSLNAGRTRRLATRHQRRALRAMYRRCAIPGCETHVSKTEPHHLTEWEHGGCTDIGLLLPVCKHHHDRLHAEHWHLALRCDRAIVISKDGKVIMTTGPPAHQWA